MYVKNNNERPYFGHPKPIRVHEQEIKNIFYLFNWNISTELYYEKLVLLSRFSLIAPKGPR